ncbi:MAG: CYTH and CHAD domain-containing protein [Nocardioidaceae bacterium]|nr:CYTH and CHAD domain-containing protein [Nocardioidaceae bacterium]
MPHGERAADHVEVERTYVLPGPFDLPDLTGVDSVASVDGPRTLMLVADYYDTDDLRLLRARTTLRRRLGGVDDGWHVKVPAPPDGRLELHRPLGRSLRPPKAVRGLVAARTAGAPLRRVATIHSHRTVRVLRSATGASLAEVCHDQVTAAVPDGRQLDWSELEVELTGGSLDLLEAVEEALTAAGAAVSPWPSKLRRALGAGLDDPVLDPGTDTAGAVVMARVAELVEELIGWDVAVRRNRPDSVHKARVTIRRLRSVLAAHRRVLDRAGTDPVRNELNWFAEVLGDVRDDEVMRGDLTDLVDTQPHDTVRAHTRRRMGRLLSDRERRHDKALRAAMDSRRHGELWAALHDVVARPPWTERAARPPAGELSKALARQLRRLDQARGHLAAQLPGPERDVALHELRKTVKRLRYTVEVALPRAGRPAHKLIRRLERFQSYAGQLHDDQVALQLLSDAADQETAFAFGHLHGVLAERVADAWAALDEEEARLEAPKLRAKLLR